MVFPNYRGSTFTTIDHIDEIKKVKPKQEILQNRVHIFLGIKI